MSERKGEAKDKDVIRNVVHKDRVIEASLSFSESLINSLRMWVELKLSERRINEEIGRTLDYLAVWLKRFSLPIILMQTVGANWTSWRSMRMNSVCVFCNISPAWRPSCFEERYAICFWRLCTRSVMKSKPTPFLSSDTCLLRISLRPRDRLLLGLDILEKIMIDTGHRTSTQILMKWWTERIMREKGIQKVQVIHFIFVILKIIIGKFLQTPRRNWFKPTNFTHQSTRL